MTTEADFQAALDADPTDWQTRLVFSDWLLDRGDMRWEGMRWLGMNRRRPFRMGSAWCGTPIGFQYEKLSTIYLSQLPVPHTVLDKFGLSSMYKPRAEAENAFCRAFPALAAAHPAEFAGGVMV